MDRILGCVIKGVDHINRFVREISYFVIKAVFVASKDIFLHEIPLIEQIENPSENEQADHAKSLKAKVANADKFKAYCDQLVPIVAQGLSDNWS